MFSEFQSSLNLKQSHDMSRPSLELQQEQERLVQSTNSLKLSFEQLSSKLRLVQNPAEFAKLEPEECGIDFDDNENRDPAVISANLTAQTVCMGYRT